MDGELTCEHLDGLAPGAYKCGAVWGIRIEVAGISLYHQGSANLDDAELRGGPVDVFLAGVAGRNFTPRYWERILPKLDPATIVPTHYDNFFKPLGSEQDFVRRVDMAGLPDEVAVAARDVRIAALPRVDERERRAG
jgi:L-ascorbate metabolism protein UlaG (beta-lactamase superfamily)